MKQNMGTIDRILRVVVGAAIIAAGYYYQNWLGAIGGILVLTAAMGFCPLYLPVGLNTKGDS